MELLDIKPRWGSDTHRLGDSDELVLIENIRAVPAGKICPQKHGIIMICTEGQAQLEYDGVTIRIQKNDFFLYMAHSVGCNFLMSSDFNCREIWFTHTALYNINLYSETTLFDLSDLKLHPVVHLTESDASMLDNYFNSLCQRMSDTSLVLQRDIVRSLFGTMLLEMLSMMRRTTKEETSHGGVSTHSHHKKRLVDKFIRLVNHSDGRIRRVDYFADQLNITPKYLSTVLKEVMNRRPSIYIQLFTLKAIKHRLCFTDMTMQEIALDLNFPNASFFGKYFKQHEGMTPMEFRMKYHSGEYEKVKGRKE